MDGRKPGLVHASGMLFAMIMAVNVGNYVFHALASRALGPEDYGSLISLVAVVTLLAVPSQAIQAAVAKTIAVEEQSGGEGRMAPLLLRLTLLLTVLGGALALGLALTGGYWAGFFKLKSRTPLLAVGAASLVSLLLPVARGALQGLQRFGQLGLNLISDSFLRLGFGAVFFALGFGITGGLLAGALSGAAALLLSAAPLGRLRPQASAAVGTDLEEIYRDGLPMLAAFGAFAVLASLDVILAKHFLPPLAAGYYSAASVVGKAFLFLPLAVAQVLLPKASAGHVREEDTRVLLRKSLLLTSATLAAGAAGAWLLAKWVILTLFGGKFLNPETLALARWFGVAISPLALTYLLVQYNLAVRHARFAWLLVADIPLLALAITLWHSRPEQVLLVLGANHLLLFVLGYGLTPGGANGRTVRVG